jgi:hypothetical protein
VPELLLTSTTLQQQPRNKQICQKRWILRNYSRLATRVGRGHAAAVWLWLAPRDASTNCRPAESWPGLHITIPASFMCRLQTTHEAAKSQVWSERRTGAGTSLGLLPLLQTHAGGAWAARHSNRQHQKRLCWPSQASRTSQRMLHETRAWLTCISAWGRPRAGSGLSCSVPPHPPHPSHPPRSAERAASSCRHHPAAICDPLQKGNRERGEVKVGRATRRPLTSGFPTSSPPS